MRSVEYRFEHRRPRGVLWVALGASTGFLVAGAATANVPLILAAAALPLPFLIWSLLFDPRSGVELAGGRLHWWRQGEDGEVALAQIRRAAVLSGEGGGQRMQLDLRDGRALDLPREVVPPGGSLVKALAERGVAISREA